VSGRGFGVARQREGFRARDVAIGLPCAAAEMALVSEERDHLAEWTSTLGQYVADDGSLANAAHEKIETIPRLWGL
jgi:hypothetical protein